MTPLTVSFQLGLQLLQRWTILFRFGLKLRYLQVRSSVTVLSNGPILVTFGLKLQQLHVRASAAVSAGSILFRFGLSAVWGFVRGQEPNWLVVLVFPVSLSKISFWVWLPQLLRFLFQRVYL